MSREKNMIVDPQKSQDPGIASHRGLISVLRFVASAARVPGEAGSLTYCLFFMNSLV